MVGCAAFGCKSDSSCDRVSLFMFPTDRKRRKLWVDRLNRDRFVPNQYSKLCVKHFEDSQFVISPKFAEQIGFTSKFRMILKPDAVPTLFEFPKRQKTTTKERKSAAAICKKKRILQIRSSVRELAASVRKEAIQIKKEITQENGLDPIGVMTPFSAETISSGTSTSTESVRKEAIQIKKEIQQEDILDPKGIMTSFSAESISSGTSTSTSTSNIRIVQYGSCPSDWFSNLASTDQPEIPSIRPTNSDAKQTQAIASAATFGAGFRTQTVSAKQIDIPEQMDYTELSTSCQCSCGKGIAPFSSQVQPRTYALKPSSTPQVQANIDQVSKPTVRSFATQTEKAPDHYSIQTQTPYNLIKRRSKKIQCSLTQTEDDGNSKNTECSLKQHKLKKVVKVRLNRLKTMVKN